MNLIFYIQAHFCKIAHITMAQLGVSLALLRGWNAIRTGFHLCCHEVSIISLCCMYQRGRTCFCVVLVRPHKYETWNFGRR
jgi:hypothetical protein